MSEIKDEEIIKRMITMKVIIDLTSNLCLQELNKNAYDFSDLGNFVGIAIAKYANEIDGLSIEDFKEGFKHGVLMTQNNIYKVPDNDAADKQP